MEMTLKRKSIDLPINVIENLSIMARKSGNTLKEYMESILTNKAAEANPSPSGDTWFDNPANIKMVNHGIKQLEEGKGTVYTASELKARLGV